MAKNYTLKEAVEIVVAGEDMEQIMEIGKRFPLLAVNIAKIGALAGNAFVDFMSYMPDHITANKINSSLKAGVVTTEAVETEEEMEEATEEKPVKAAPKKEAKSGSYEEMTGNQLVELCKERDIWKGLKDRKKAGMIAALEEFDANGGSEAEEVEEAEVGKYDGKSAMELFKECKARGIKAAPKKPAKFYVELLETADAESAEEETEDEWGEEEAEEKPVKKPAAKSAPKAKTSKPAKKVEEEEEDDEWDI